MTTKEDALKIFAKFADKNGVGFGDYGAPYYEDNIRFSPSSHDGVDAFTLNGRISLMVFGGYFGKPLTLQDAIKLFGQPESVSVDEAGIHYNIELFIPSKGIVFGYGKPGEVGNDQIEPSQLVGMFCFFDPSQYDLFLNYLTNGNGNKIKQSLHPWDGYGTIRGKYWPPITSSQ